MLAKIIDIYNKQPRKGSFIEFEMRSTIDAAQHKKYIDAIGNRAKIEYSINFINNTILNRSQSKSDQYVRKIIFESTTLDKVSETYYKKTRLSPPFSIHDQKLVVSEERPIEKFATNLNSTVRFKIRHSVEHVFAGKKWALDITATITYIFDEIKDKIAELKNAFFKGSRIEQKIMYEFEIEYADTAPIAISDIDGGDANVLTDIYNLLDPTFKSRNDVASQIRSVMYAIKGADRKAETVKAATNQVIALTKNVYYRELYPPVGYYATEKLDGTRALVKIAAKKCYIITNSLETHSLPNTATATATALTVVDAEYANGIVYVFDVLILNGADITALPFKQRYERIEEAVKIIKEYVACEAKQFVVLELKNMETTLKKIFNAEYEYAIDGIIFTSPNESYYNTKNYKWKPSEDNTIDFLVKRGGGDGNYLLFVGISRAAFEKFGITHLSAYGELFPSVPSNYFPVHFCPSLNPCAYTYKKTTGDAEDLDGKIVEFVLTEKGEWDAVRVRVDRVADGTYFGNDFKVAETIYSNYLDKFELRDLYSAPNTYFRESAESVYRAANHYRRQIADNLIKTYFSNKKTIIDEACGRGADIRRYVVNRIQNVVFIDIDATAIAELISRKYSLIKNTDIKSSINVYALIANLNEPHKKIAEKIANAKFCLDAANGILCNFAFHYMAGSNSSIKNLLTLNYNLMTSGSYFIFTTFDGAKVFELLKTKKINDSWTLTENNRVKYSITKKFLGDKMAETGQVIGVMLPFSDETYDEFLVNFTTVSTIAESVGFKVVLNKSFGDFELNARGEQMSEADIEYNKLYSAFVLQKN